MTTSDKKHILVVDDDPEITRMLQIMLEFHGFAVTRAHGTAQGMTMLSKETPDLVLLDFMMPHLDGLELCSYIRRDPRTANVPVIIFSAASGDDRLQAAMNAGATRFIQKTVGKDELMKAITDTLGSA